MLFSEEKISRSTRSMCTYFHKRNFLWLLPKNNQYLTTQIIVLNCRNFSPKFQKFVVPKKHIFAQSFAQIFGLKIFEHFFAKFFLVWKKWWKFVRKYLHKCLGKKNLCKFFCNYLHKILGLKIVAQIFVQKFVQIFGEKNICANIFGKICKKIAQIFYGSYLMA